MKSYCIALLLTGTLVIGLSACSDPATESKRETTDADSALIPPPGYNYPTDTTTGPVPANTTLQQ